VRDTDIASRKQIFLLNSNFLKILIFAVFLIQLFFVLRIKKITDIFDKLTGKGWIPKMDGDIKLSIRSF